MMSVHSVEQSKEKIDQKIKSKKNTLNILSKFEPRRHDATTRMHSCSDSRLCIDACSFKIHGLVKQKNRVLRLYPSVMTLMMRSSLPLAQISAMVRSFYDRRLRTLHG